MVHPSITRGLLVDLIFKQVTVSLRMTGPVGEDGVCSPAFVSECTGMYSYSTTNARVLERF